MSSQFAANETSQFTAEMAKFDSLMLQMSRFLTIPAEQRNGLAGVMKAVLNVMDAFDEAVSSPTKNDTELVDSTDTEDNTFGHEDTTTTFPSTTVSDAASDTSDLEQEIEVEKPFTTTTATTTTTTTGQMIPGAMGIFDDKMIAILVTDTPKTNNGYGKRYRVKVASLTKTAHFSFEDWKKYFGGVKFTHDYSQALRIAHAIDKNENYSFDRRQFPGTFGGVRIIDFTDGVDEGETFEF